MLNKTLKVDPNDFTLLRSVGDERVRINFQMDAVQRGKAVDLSGVPIADVAGFKKNRRRIVLPAPVPIVLHSHGDDDGKYGRLLSTVWLLDPLNELLLSTGHATVPSYA